MGDITVLSLIAALIVGIYLVRLMMRSLSVPIKKIEADLEVYRFEVERLETTVRQLDKLTNDYLHSLQAAGFVDLRRIVDALRKGVDILNELFELEDYKTSREILDYVRLEAQLSDLSPRAFARVRDLGSDLSDWRMRVRRLVLQLVDEINEHSINYNEVGRVRASDRTATREVLESIVQIISSIPSVDASASGEARVPSTN